MTMEHDVIVNEHDLGIYHDIRAISWSSIIAGALVAIGLSFLLSIFNLGMGLSTWTVNETGLRSMAIVGLIWMIITTIAIMYVAGWTAGHFADPYYSKRSRGFVHGFITWILAIFLTVILSAHFGASIGSNFHMFYDTTPNANVSTSGAEMHGATNHSANPKMHSSNATQDETNVEMINAEKIVHSLGEVTLGTFFLLLVGALASCIGSVHGLRCAHDCCCVCHDHDDMTPSDTH